MQKTLLLALCALTSWLPLYAILPNTEFTKTLFTIAYERYAWGSKESHSGYGSTLHRTMLIRPFIHSLLHDLQIKSILDVACGDFNWMKEIDLKGIAYTGIDIVEELIAENMRRYGTENRQFSSYDIIRTPLPQADLIICRDCTQHLTDEEVMLLMKNIKKSGSRYLLTSNYPDREENKDLETIYSVSRITYRNLCKPPFHFPDPLVIFPEGFDNKALCLWEIKSLP